MNNTEVLDALTEKSIIKLIGESFVLMTSDEYGETLLLSRSFDQRQLTLWKIKK